jgi:hypothetical protein
MAEQKPDVANAQAPAHLNIKIKSQEGDHIEFKVKPTTKFEKVRRVLALYLTLRSSLMTTLPQGCYDVNTCNKYILLPFHSLTWGRAT